MRYLIERAARERAARLAGKAKPAFKCKCPPKEGDLDYSKIGAIMGASDVTCLVCGGEVVVKTADREAAAKKRAERDAAKK